MSLWDMLATLAVSNILSFGNGTVMAAVLQRSFVQDAHVLTNDQLLYAFALARVTPGQANLYVASIAYMMFGLPGAILSMVVIALPSYLMLPLLRSYEAFKGSRVVFRFTRGLASTAVGILLATTFSLSKDSVRAPISVGIVFLALVLMFVVKLPTLASLVAATGVGILLVVVLPGLA